MDWSLRGCARHGHDTYAPTEVDLAEHLRVETVVGPAWRCLRCGSYVVGEPAASGPAEDAPTPLRGRAARDAVILRLLAAERGIRAVFLLLTAYLIVRFAHAEESLRALLDRALPAARPLAAVLHYDLDNSATITRLRHLVNTTPHTLTLVALGLVAYGALQLTEAVGLWLLKRWGEYVAVVGTSAFVPLEVYELVDKVSVVKAVLLVVNLAAVVWLVYSKRLFGVRGGGAAFEAERHAESLLEVTRAATPVAQPDAVTNPDTRIGRAVADRDHV